MNRQIVKLFAFTVVLFAVLIGFTSYWSVFDAEALKDKEANKRPLLEQQQIRRGRILAADGTVIARSVPKGRGDSPALRAPLPGRVALRPPDRLQLRAPGRLASSRSTTTTSWSATNRNSARSSTSCAAGSRKATTSSPTSIRRRSGSRWKASRTCPGSAPSSRSSRAPAGSGCWPRTRPTTRTAFPTNSTKLNRNELEAPLVDRGTQSRYPPGSTFKVVTAAAALDSGTITPETPIDAPGSLDVQGQPLENDFGTSYSGLTLDDALTNSVNTWFAQVGERVGEDTLFEYMDKFGFNTKPAIDLPSEQLDDERHRRTRKRRRARAATTRSTSPGSRSARSACWPPRCRSPRSRRRSPTRGTLMKPQIWSRVDRPRRPGDRTSSTPPSTASRSARRPRRS